MKRKLFPKRLICALVIAAACAVFAFTVKGSRYALLVLLAALIHESGHILSAKLFGVRTVRSGKILQLSLKYDFSNVPYATEALIAASGAFFNLVSCVICGAVFGFQNYNSLFFIFSSAALAFFNLMPISPLDGFGIITALLSEIADDATVYKITCFLSGAFSLSFFVLTAYIQLRVGANLSLMLISVLLLLNCFREK